MLLSNKAECLKVIFLICFVLVIGSCGGTGSNLEDLKPIVSQQTVAPSLPVVVESTNAVISQLAALETPAEVDPELFSELKAAFARALEEYHFDRITSSAPDGDAGKVTKIYVSEGMLRWTYESRGDGDGNGEVNVADITPIAINYSDVVGDGDDDIMDAWVDGDNNGEVNLADITPIAVNYMAQCSGYKILTADVPEGPYTELGLVAFDEGVLESFPPGFDFEVPVEALSWLVVQPYDDGNQPGALSIAVPSGGGGAIAYFEGEVNAPVADNIPDLPVLVPAVDNFDYDDDPRGVEIVTSRTRINIIFAPDTTVGDANAALMSIGAIIAGTVPEVGMVVAEIPDTGGFASLHDALDVLSQNTHVLTSVQDTLLSPTVLNHPSDSEDPTKGNSAPAGLADPNPWLWEFPPLEISDFNGNWGMEAIRAPQAWNLTDYARRGSGPPRTMVLDLGFNDVHPDGEMANLAFYTNDGTASIAGLELHYHGMHIAGTIGGEHYNNIGVAGLNPLLSEVTQVSEKFIAYTMREALFNRGAPYDSREVAFSTIMHDLSRAIRSWPDTKVVNLSLGYNWYKGGIRPINANEDTDAQSVCKNHGKIMRFFVWFYSDPIYVAAAGNDSGGANSFPEEMEAVWASPFCWAGLSPDPAYPLWINLPASPNFVIVESANATVPDQANSPNAWDYTKSDFSNMGGHIGAPGSDVLSCVGDNVPSGWSFAENYESLSGTSMASPHVTGLISYLATVDPLLTQEELISLVTGANYTTGLVLDEDDLTPANLSAPNERMIDAFAAVIGIDSVQGSRGIQKALVDVDDGTWDGNYREDLYDGGNTGYPPEPDPNTIHTIDMRRGDTKVTMRDFRVYRDAYIAVHHGEFPIGWRLDGSATHFKKDLNFDGAVYTNGTNGQAVNPSHPVGISNATVLNRVVPETMYPRCDFNGDGEVADWAQTAPYRIDPATPVGSNDTTAALTAPGMLRDIDVLATTGYWQPFDILAGQPNSEEYWEYVVNLSAQEGANTSKHWSPARYLLGNRDATANVDPAFQHTPDYLHSTDLHFAIDWTHIGVVSDEITFTITSPIDGVVDDFTRTGTFTPDDPWKFVVTVPIWTSQIEVTFDAGPTYFGSKSFSAQLGQDIPVAFSNVIAIPPIRWWVYEFIPTFEPVFWVRSYGVGEGWYERTVGRGPYEDGVGHPLIFARSENGVQQGTPKTVANLPNPQLMAAGDIWGNPTIVADDGEGNLMLYHSVDSGDNWTVEKTLDTGAQFDFTQASFVDFSSEQFVIYSKDNGSGVMTAYYCRNTTGSDCEFSTPLEIGPGYAPSAAVVGGVVMLALRDPAAITAPFLVTYEWDPIQAEFNLQPGHPPAAYTGVGSESLTFELFNNNGYPAILLNSSGRLSFVLDNGSGMSGGPIGQAELPDGYEFKSWVRPQGLMLDGRLACMYRGSYWLSSAAGESWSPASIPLGFGEASPDLDFVRASAATEILSMEFFDTASQSMVIQTQTFGAP